MASNNLTPEQQAVIASNAQSLLVSASAGSGKTTVLVERYLRHVLIDGISPSAIWAVTFTHKAASEMRSRILARFRAESRFDLMEEAETGPIGTLDGLCERLLRENAIDAGLDPAYEVLGNDDFARLRSDAIKQALAGIEGSDELDTWEADMAGETAWNRTEPHSELLKQLGDFISNFRNGRLTVDELEARYSSPEVVLGLWRSEALNSCPVNDIERARLSKSLESPDFWEQLKTTLGTERSPKWLGGAPDWPSEKRGAAHTARLVRLGCEAWRQMEWEMLRRGQLDFSYQQRLVLGLLQTSSLVRKRLSMGLGAVMVDEAQDLNPLQFLLLDQFRAALGNSGYVTLVGDSKQSIYGFRQATPAQFDRLAETWASLALTRNHRSVVGIQRYVDDWSRATFERYLPMLPEGQASTPAAEVEVLSGGFNAQIVAGKVADLIAEGWKPGQIAVLGRKWTSMNEVGSILQQKGILSQASGARTKFHAHLTVRDLAATLRALVDPTDDLAYLTVLRSPMADLSLDGIVELARLGEANKPEGTKLRLPLSLIEWRPSREDDLEKYERFSTWFEPLQKQAGRLPAWEVLSAVLAQSGYLEAMATRPEAREALANARKLFRMACEKPLLSAAEFALQVRKIQQLDFEDVNSAVEVDENAVILTTVHSAKGLEFDVVVVAEMPKEGRYDQDLEIDLLGERIAMGQAKKQHPFYRFLAQVKQEGELAEAARSVYVALTRAKKRLIIFATDRTIGKRLLSVAKPSSSARRNLQVVQGGKSD